MSFTEEVKSWMFPTSVTLSKPPSNNGKAPSLGQLKFPSDAHQPTIVTFLRHCGCPFAEKTFRSMRDAAASRPEYQFVAVSHSSQSHTDKWLRQVGGAGKVKVILDEERTIYARWGLGASSSWHLLSPVNFYHMYQTAREQGITNRPTESGNRWQTAGAWAVDGEGIIRWGRAMEKAHEIPDFQAAIASLGSNSS